jgi:F0F1-type ATP synthase membrane subunit b/b'
VLAERFRLTECARQAAEESLKSADSKIAEYEAALAKARGEIYTEQAEFLRKLHEEQAERAKAARIDSDHRISIVKESIAKEVLTAREGLEAQSDALASQIADSILSRRVA